MQRAAARGRVPRGKGIYITEFGYQTNPPDRISRITPRPHARYINESDRLFFGDTRVKTVSQYQLVDVNDVDQYNSGLRFAGGTKRKKASYDAYRLPIVVTRKSPSLVEVYGQVRPARQARLANVFAAPELQFAPRGRGFQTIRRPGLNSVGIFRTNIRRGGAAAGRWRIKWQNGLLGGVSYSRVAKAGKPMRYYRDCRTRCPWTSPRRGRACRCRTVQLRSPLDRRGLRSPAVTTPEGNRRAGASSRPAPSTAAGAARHRRAGGRRPARRARRPAERRRGLLVAGGVGAERRRLLRSARRLREHAAALLRAAGGAAARRRGVAARPGAGCRRWPACRSPTASCGRCSERAWRC